LLITDREFAVLGKSISITPNSP